MRLRINVLISALALLTIIWGIRFIVARERGPQYLQGMYQELNKQFFENALPTARFEWADLTKADAMGQTSQETDGSFLVLVDRKTNFGFFGDDELTHTVEHEACHIATWGAEQDAHGPKWQECMARIHSK